MNQKCDLYQMPGIICKMMQSESKYTYGAGATQP